MAADTETIGAMRPPAPVALKDRIFTLDLLRGWAVLGILAVNAMTFAWPLALDMGEMSGLVPPYPHDAGNIRGDWATTVFFQDKFRTLFSMLFGVSIFLIGGQKYDPVRGPLLTRRLMWLGLFGLIHGAVFWWGDILLHYAYCGLIAMTMRSWSAKRLIWTGGGLNLAIGVIAALFWLAAGALEAAGAPGASTTSMQGNPFAMTQAQIAAVIDAYQAGWPGAQVENLKTWLMMQSASLFLIPITVGLMLLGLGLFKAGFLAGRSPAWVYGLVAVLGMTNLAALAWFGWMDAAVAPGVADPSRGLGKAAGSFAPLITLGYVSLLILFSRFGLRFLTARLAPVGRMAFTNYLSQTLIMATLFYMPWGPHWFGDPAWGPGRLWTAVGAIWVLQLVWSPLWLSRFQMGPLEWAWRCLTYGRRVPLRK